MAVDQSDMDSPIEVTIPVELVNYRFGGEMRQGFIFKNTLRVAFQSGETCIVPAPPAFTALPDFQVSGFTGADGLAAVNFTQSPSAVIWRFEVAPRDRDDFDNPVSITNVFNP